MGFRSQVSGVLALVAVVVLVVAGCSPGGDGGPGTQPPGAVAPRAVPTVVVVDASESMTTADAPGPRIDAARAAVLALADALPDGTELGVVAFGSTMSARLVPQVQACTDVVTPVPLGPIDRPGLSVALDGLVAQGFTPIGSALETAADRLPLAGPASIVLVSDGRSTCAPDPCETAARIHSARPEVTISAVGFRTDDPSLQCIADSGGGIFVTADNAEQLTARLSAAQDSENAATRLSTTSRDGIAIGDSLDDVRAAHPDFPQQGGRSGDLTIYVWRDCRYGFDSDGRLVEIAPGDPPGRSGVTIDGVGAGTPGSRAIELYGDPVSDSDGVAIFPADEKAGTGYRMEYDGGSSVADGRIITVVLCGCLPGTGDDSSGGPEVETVIAVDKDGKPINGWSIDESGGRLTFPESEMEYCSHGLGAKTPGVFRCGSTADSAVVCWDDSAGSQLLCAYSPYEKKLRPFHYLVPPNRQPVEGTPRPWAIELADGTRCVQRFGGAWGAVADGYYPMYGCDADPWLFIIAENADAPLFDESGDQWTTTVSGSAESGIPAHQVPVKRVYYSAAQR